MEKEIKVVCSGQLVDVFNITGKGTVVMVGYLEGEPTVNMVFVCGQIKSSVLGIDYPRMAVPSKHGKLLGVLLESVLKEDLLPLLKEPVQLVSHEE